MKVTLRIDNIEYRLPTLDMGMPKGKKIDPEALRSRRLQARQLRQDGLSQAKVARRLGVSRAAVSNWEEMKIWELNQVKRQGRTPVLDEFNRNLLRSRLAAGPMEQGRYTGEKWTIASVQKLIWECCKKKFSRTYTWRLLQQLGPRREL